MISRFKTIIGESEKKIKKEFFILQIYWVDETFFM